MRAPVSIHAPRGARPTANSKPPTPRPFQSTRPRGARPRGRRRRSSNCWSFNPRAHAGRDDPQGAEQPLPPGFQSRRPRGARLCSRLRYLAGSRFNPRAHAGRDLRSRFGLFHFRLFQSTRPRGARLGSRPVSRKRPDVSIHAPTRGATCPSRVTARLLLCFNPRAHAGRDAPLPTPSTSSSASFNPRAHAGRDAYGGKQLCVDNLEFQSTRPRGARRLHMTPGSRLPTFQSTRPRGARRPCMHRWLVSWPVSIHAPTRGATSDA